MPLNLQEISDRMEIDEILQKYSIAIDQRRFRDLEDLFAHDAECDFGSLGIPRGPREISTLIEQTLQGLDGTQHHIGKSVYTIDGDTAAVRTYLISQHVRKDAPGEQHYFVGGEYVDTFVRTPSGWRIRTRQLDRQWTEGDRRVILGRP